MAADDEINKILSGSYHKKIKSISSIHPTILADKLNKEGLEKEDIISIVFDSVDNCYVAFVWVNSD